MDDGAKKLPSGVTFQTTKVLKSRFI